jgi:hypothetical protein
MTRIRYCVTAWSPNRCYLDRTRKQKKKSFVLFWRQLQDNKFVQIPILLIMSYGQKYSAILCIWLLKSICQHVFFIFLILWKASHWWVTGPISRKNLSFSFPLLLKSCHPTNHVHHRWDNPPSFAGSSSPTFQFLSTCTFQMHYLLLHYIINILCL